MSAQVVEPCTPYERDVGQTGRQAGGLSCCRSGGQHAASRHCQEGGGRQTLLAGEDKTPFPPVFLQSDPYQIKSLSKHLLVRARYAILSSLSGKYCHCRDVFLDIHLHMILSTEAKLHERIICSEWSNMSYKHDIVFSIKSLGLLTQTTHSLVFFLGAFPNAERMSVYCR